MTARATLHALQRGAAPRQEGISGSFLARFAKQAGGSREFSSCDPPHGEAVLYQNGTVLER